MSKPNLLVDWCDYEAAKYAVMHWHYSKAMPSGKIIKIGAWEARVFVGAVIFSRGANKHIGSPYGLNQIHVCELTRVALSNNHVCLTSKIVSCAIRLLKQQSKDLRLLISYADTEQAHIGTIYQAMNWIYEGECLADSKMMVLGQITHRRTISSRYGTYSLDWLQQHVDPEARVISCLPKHKYLYPLDKAMRRQILPLAQPYPKHAGEVLKVTRPAPSR